MRTDGERRRQRSAQQIEAFGHNGTRCDRPVLPVAAAAEGQDLVHNPLRTLPRSHDLLHVATRRVGLSQQLEPHFAVTENGAENIVELMGNAAGERADRLQPLGLVHARFERLACALALLALDRTREYLAGGAQQRDVIIVPAPFGRDRVEREKARLAASMPHWNAEPSSNAAPLQLRLLRALRKRLNPGYVNASLPLVALQAPSRCSRKHVLMATGLRSQTRPQPQIAAPDAGRIGAPDDDVSAIHAGKPSHPRKPVLDLVVDAPARQIDELRGDFGDHFFEVEADLQVAGIGAQPEKQVADIARERDRRGIEQDPERCGPRGSAAMEVEIHVLQTQRPIADGRGL